jgi:DNA-binding NtrC family response regulator
VGIHTLLIDDDKSFTRSIEQFFIMNRINLDIASSWQEGLVKYQVGLHELVIADYRLPESDHGLKLLAHIKPLRPLTELILISGEITSVPEEKIKISGLVNEYYAKTGRLPSLLVEKAREAEKRANSPTNWKDLAQAYLTGREVDKQQLEDIDKLIRADVEGTS